MTDDEDKLVRPQRWHRPGFFWLPIDIVVNTVSAAANVTGHVLRSAGSAIKGAVNIGGDAARDLGVRTEADEEEKKDK